MLLGSDNGAVNYQFMRTDEAEGQNGGRAERDDDDPVAAAYCLLPVTR